MLGTPTKAWGKLKRDEHGKVVAWHSVVDHCADVAACCEAILACSLIRKRMAVLAGLGDLTPRQVSRLCVLAAFHDLGKFNRGFQSKSQPFPPSPCGHVVEASVPLLGGDSHPERDDIVRALGLMDLRYWGDEETILQLLLASISHHGKPAPLNATLKNDPWRKTERYDPFVGLSELGQKVREWFPLAFADGSEPLPDEKAFAHAFSGLVMLADWLGSDARDEFFSYDDDCTADRMPYARVRSAKAVRMIGLDPAPSREAFKDEAPRFDHVSPFSPRPQQRAVASVPLSKHGSVVVLEAETGAGKTEAALLHYLRLLHEGLVDGMYFALPTRTAATQIQRRVDEAMKRAFPSEDARPVTVLAVPGYIVADDATGKRLPGFETLWTDEKAELQRHRRWAAEHPKRYLAAAVSVGTIDQVLLSALRVGHTHMRATALLRNLLVVDEVHASDAYMNAILEQVLRRHVRAGGHALLMSATLGSSARGKLLAACGDKSTTLTLDNAKAVSFPTVISYRSGGKSEPVAIESTGQEQNEAKPKDVRIEIAAVMNDPVVIARRALDFARKGARVIVIRNTVKGCLAVQRALEQRAEASANEHLLFKCNDVPAPHHSRYSKEDRENLDKAIELEFDKRRSPGGLVVVATQTVQQSLDLDADVMITDLCPMDVLLQRFGRLHRHDRAGRRAPGFEQPRAVILVPENRDLALLINEKGVARSFQGIGRVYDDLRIIEATWRQLDHAPGRTLSIPDMNRELVERATHPAVLADIAAQGDDRWKAHQTYITGDVLAKLRHAISNLASWDCLFDEQEFSSDEGRRIATRLGDQDRRVEFAGADLPMGPFGNAVRELPIPAFMAPANEDADVVTDSRDLNGFEFHIGKRRYRYDQYGLRTI